MQWPALTGRKRESDSPGDATFPPARGDRYGTRIVRAPSRPGPADPRVRSALPLPEQGALCRQCSSSSVAIIWSRASRSVAPRFDCDSDPTAAAACSSGDSWLTTGCAHCCSRGRGSMWPLDPIGVMVVLNRSTLRRLDARLRSARTQL
jgi:hypothetical protein